MKSDHLLRIENLEIRAVDDCLVAGASFDIGKREVVGLVGESGSGKTITALSVINLLPPPVKLHGGSILISDESSETDLTTLSAHGMNRIRGRRIAMIFQEPMTSLNPTLRCGFQAREPLMNHMKTGSRDAKRKVLELFEEVGLPNPERIYRAWPHELSGGQRQRVMIAQALSTEPALLIADEPTTALDVTVQKKILELLLVLKKKYGLSILLISHDLGVVNQIADRVVVMEKGRIVEAGTKQQVMKSPRSPYTKGLIACRPKLDEYPHRLPTVMDFITGKQVLTRQAVTNGPGKKPQIPLVSVKNLQVVFRSGSKQIIKAVNNITLDIYRGETLGLVGESGSGKTTLGRSILGLIGQKSGEISFEGQPLNALSEKAFRKTRRRMQIVFQDPYSSLNPRMTVGTIIGEPFRIHRLYTSRSDVRSASKDILDRVGLPASALQKYPHEFSGGQRQRICIARALACNPDFIVLDESVSALDVSIQAQVINLLNDLKEELGLTYLFISHDLTVVNYMSDRIIVMKDGQIVEEAAAGELHRYPKSDYTRELINAIPE